MPLVEAIETGIVQTESRKGDVVLKACRPGYRHEAKVTWNGAPERVIVPYV